MEELEAERLELVDAIQSIDIQLSEPNRVDPETGQRLNGYAYLDWRRSAQTAKRVKLDRLREVNLELKRLGSEAENKWKNRIEEKLDRIIELLEEEYEV